MIPNCPQCDEPGVRWRNMWVCRDCFELATHESKVGYEAPPTISIGEALPNRAARRLR